MRLYATLVVAVTALAPMILHGCSGEDSVEIVADCHQIGEPVAVARSVRDSLFFPSVGRVAHLRFITWHGMSPEQATSDPIRATVWGRWYDEAFEPTGSPVNLGPSVYLMRQTWVRHDGSLVAQHWAQHPDDAAEERPLTYRRNLWQASVDPSRPEEVAFDRVEFDAIPYCDGCARMSNGANRLDPGPGPLTTATAGDEPLLGFAAIPQECDTHFANFQRAFVGNGERGAEPLPLGGDLCPEDDTVAYSIQASNVWLFGREDGAGLLFRWAGEPSNGRLQYVALDDRGMPVGEPRPVGKYSDFWTSSEGLLPRAVELPNGQVLFSEQVRATPERCFRLRLMDGDGSNPRDAPWQIPCPEGPDGDRMTHYVEMAALPMGAILVWSGRSGHTRSTFDSPAGYEDGVYAVVITAQGKRGSEIVELTPPDATLLVPGVGDTFVGQGAYMPMVAVEGNEVTIVWQETVRRAIYARELRCDPTP